MIFLSGLSVFSVAGSHGQRGLLRAIAAKQADDVATRFIVKRSRRPSDSHLSRSVDSLKMFSNESRDENALPVLGSVRSVKGRYYGITEREIQRFKIQANRRSRSEGRARAHKISSLFYLFVPMNVYVGRDYAENNLRSAR